MIVTERHTHTPYVGYSTISQATPPSLTLTSRDDATRPASVGIPLNPKKPRDQSRGQLSRQDLVRQSPNRLCRRVRKVVQTTSENDRIHGLPV